MIPYGQQSIVDKDIDAVVEVLKSDFITQGPNVPAFESAVAEYCGARHSVAVNSATSALHLACKVLGVGPGDIVWTSPISFVASANCALYCGAAVDFVDIERDTGNMSVSALTEKLAEANEMRRLPKVIIPVHFSGQSCDMEGISSLAKEYGISVIEDASHAIGASYQNQKVGSCKFSDITVFSFHPVKIITTAEGGLATTNNADLASRLALLRSHGVTRDPDLMENDTEGAWYYEQIDLGFNYRMTDLQAALGRSQMDRLDELVSRRNELAKRYDQELAGFKTIQPLRIDDDCYSSFHLYVIRLSSDAKIGRTELFSALRDDGIGVNVHYKPIHTQPYYEKLGFKPQDFEHSVDFYSKVISIPLHPQLSDDQLSYIVACLKKYVD